MRHKFHFHFPARFAAILLIALFSASCNCSAQKLNSWFRSSDSVVLMRSESETMTLDIYSAVILNNGNPDFELSYDAMIVLYKNHGYEGGFTGERMMKLFDAAAGINALAALMGEGSYEPGLDSQMGKKAILGRPVIAYESGYWEVDDDILIIHFTQYDGQTGENFIDLDTMTFYYDVNSCIGGVNGYPLRKVTVN